MTTLQNMKGRISIVWDGMSLQERQAVSMGDRICCKRLCNRLYQSFNSPFDHPGNIPYDPRDPIDFTDKIHLLAGFAGAQQAFLNQNQAWGVCIQDREFLTPQGPQRQHYESLFMSLPSARLCNCFFHFNYPSGQPQDMIRIAVNVHPCRTVGAIEDWLLLVKQNVPELTSFKVAGPDITRKPDTVLLYLNKPRNDPDNEAIVNLLQTISQWASQGLNVLRDWVHPLQPRQAAGIGIADDPPSIPAYNGISFTALRATITSMILIGVNPAVVGDAAADAVESQLANYGINAQDPAQNANLPNNQTVDAIANYAIWLGMKVQ